MKNILVVDDSPTIRTAVKYTLKSQDINILEAENGDQAINTINEMLGKGQSIDLYLTDVNMPNINGIDLIKEIRKNDKFAPIIVLTTEGSSDMIQKGKEAGASGWLVKPFQPKLLVDTIKKFV